MPIYSTTKPAARASVARVIKLLRGYVRDGNCRAAKYMMQSLGAMAMDISDTTYFRLHRKYKDACPTRKRRR